MIRLLRLAAIAAILGGLALVAGSLPWRAWFGQGDLAMLPERQTDFIFDPLWPVVVPPLVLLLVDAAAAALTLLALAVIVERLESIGRLPLGAGDSAPPGPPSAPLSMPIGNRLASARNLRIVAAAVIVATVAAVLAQFPWWIALWRESVLHDTYFVFNPGSIVGLLVVEGIAALLLFALALILDRLDDIQGG